MDDTLQATRLAIVDDDDLFRELLTRSLATFDDLDVVASFGSSSEAALQIPAICPDVALLDIELGEDLDGVQLARRLRTRLPRLGIVLLSNHRRVDCLRSLPPSEAGGWSYLLKTSVRELASLERAITGAGRGYVVLDREIAEALHHGAGEAVGVSPAGFEVWRLIAQGYSNAAIADRLCLSGRTVEGRIATLYRQLGVATDDDQCVPRVLATLRFLEIAHS